MFDKLAKAALGVVTAPVDVAADLVTGFGMATDRDEPYTVSKARKIYRQIDEATD